MPVKGRGFEWALKELKAGRSVARVGWNGRDMALYLVPGSRFLVEKDRPLAKHLPVGTACQYLPHVDMRNAQGQLVPWLASQGDLLAEDWVPARVLPAPPADPVGATPGTVPKSTPKPKAAKAAKPAEPKSAAKPKVARRATPEAVIQKALKGAKPNGAARAA